MSDPEGNQKSKSPDHISGARDPGSLHDILEMIIGLARLDFGKLLPLKGDNSIQDSLSSGLNMLAEELKYSVVSRAELEIKNSLIESILENIPIALYLKDAKDKFKLTLWNKAAERIFERPRDEVLGKTAHDLFPTELADRILANDAEVFKKGIPVEFPEEPAVTKSRRNIFVHMRKVPIGLTGTNESSHLLCVCEDITEAKKTRDEVADLLVRERRAAEDLLIAKQEAEAANLAKSSFLANMSHEIRTPLGAVLGFVDLMIDPEISASEKVNFAAVIKRNGELLSNIINDILDLSKIEAGKMKIVTHETPLTEILTDTKALLDLQARDKGIALNVAINENVPNIIRTDPLRLRQVLFNVICNAIKFTSKGSVDVEVERRIDGQGNDRLIFTVKDTGAGISEAQIKNLFTSFSQADISSKRAFGGTGLGLVLSKRFANLLGGDVELTQTTLNQGSTFTITIDPGLVHTAYFDVPQVGKYVALHQERPQLEGVKVLLADDASDNRMLVSRMLSLAGATVEVAANGREAVDKVRGEGYDVVLMDLQMPVMDGYEATSELRKDGYSGKIIALTAHALNEERERCLQSGFDDHIAKPVNRKLLIDRVDFFSRQADASI
jgi:PAS domain S-box-containing protein